MHQSTTFIYKLKKVLRSYMINHSNILQNFVNFISPKIQKTRGNSIKLLF